MEVWVFFLIGQLVLVATLLVYLRLASFRAQRPEDYAGQEPAIDIRQHLSGPLQCEGVIYGPTGRVSSRFVARFDGQWDGGAGILRETFDYDSGTTQERQWLLRVDEDGEITALASDVAGEGRGWQRGSAVLLEYRIRLPDSAGGHVLDVTDWMYLTSNGTIMNRSQFRKFGIKVAELVATMRPVSVETPEREAA